jgi:hypothetical protein
MSALGRTFRHVPPALTPKADMCGAAIDVRFGPIAELDKLASAAIRNCLYDASTFNRAHLKQKAPVQTEAQCTPSWLRRLATKRASLTWFLSLARRAKAIRLGTVLLRLRCKVKVGRVSCAQARRSVIHASACGCLRCSKDRTQRKHGNCCN